MASKKETIQRILPKAMEIVKEKGIKLSEVVLNDGNDPTKEAAYTHQKFIQVFKGYDFLENMAFVRAHIMKKYEIKTINLLEILLFLFPKNLFTIYDYRDIGHIRFTYKRLNVLVKLGYAGIACHGRNQNEHLYVLTAKSRKIVMEFYGMLSGEIPVPEDVLRESNVVSDLKKVDVIKKINLLLPSEPKRTLWSKRKKATD
ncbi:hypothetical protein [Flavobacterium sp. JP2137]|uniref:hypothetical protein n=1 Tax=Flavobacterium sp. JP2137 TaxID=3414510 RepID=UPI003D2FA8FD